MAEGCYAGWGVGRQPGLRAAEHRKLPEPYWFHVALKRFGLIACATLLAVILWLGIPLREESTQSRSVSPPESDPMAGAVAVTTVPTPGAVGSGPVAPLLGETILRDYANSNLPPANDLTLMSRLMENSLLLLKSAGNRPLSANEDWAELLRGQNGAGERFLPDRHPALAPDGKLVDRWGTPLFIHALGGGRFELRSGGPDQRLWTADDIHRNADGSFRRGASLNADSLLPPVY